MQEDKTIVITAEQKTNTVNFVADGSGTLPMSRNVYSGQTLTKANVKPADGWVIYDISVVSGTSSKTKVWQNPLVRYENGVAATPVSLPITDSNSGLTIDSAGSSSASMTLSNIAKDTTITVGYAKVKKNEDGSVKRDPANDNIQIVEPKPSDQTSKDPDVDNPRDQKFEVNTSVVDANDNLLVGAMASGSGIYTAGDSVNVVLAAPSGYKLKSVVVNGSPIPQSSYVIDESGKVTYTIQSISSDMTIKGVFDNTSGSQNPDTPSDINKKTHTIRTVAQGLGGTISGAGTYVEGSNVKVSWSAAAVDGRVNAVKYVIINGVVRVDLAPKSTEASAQKGEFTFENLNEDSYISVVFYYADELAPDVDINGDGVPDLNLTNPEDPASPIPGRIPTGNIDANCDGIIDEPTQSDLAYLVIKDSASTDKVYKTYTPNDGVNVGDGILSTLKKMNNYEAKAWADNLAKEKGLKFIGWTVDALTNVIVLDSDKLGAGTTTVLPVFAAGDPGVPAPPSPVDPGEKDPGTVEPDPTTPTTPITPGEPGSDYPAESYDVVISQNVENVSAKANSTGIHHVGDKLHYTITFKNNNLASWSGVSIHENISRNVLVDVNSIRVNSYNTQSGTTPYVSAKLPDSAINYDQNSEVLDVNCYNAAGQVDSIALYEMRTLEFDATIQRSDLPGVDESVAPIYAQATIIGDALYRTENGAQATKAGGQTRKVYLSGWGAAEWAKPEYSLKFFVATPNNKLQVTTGDVVTYNAFIENTAQYSQSTNTVFETTLPKGMSYVGGSLAVTRSDGQPVDVAANVAGGKIALNLGTMHFEDTINVTYKATVTNLNASDLKSSFAVADGGYKVAPTGKYPAKTSEALKAGEIYVSGTSDGVSSVSTMAGAKVSALVGPEMEKTYDVKTSLVGYFGGQGNDACTISDSRAVKQGQNYDLSVNVADGYEVAYIALKSQGKTTYLSNEDIAKATSGKYTLVSINENVEITAKVFRLPTIGSPKSDAINQYTISVNAYSPEMQAVDVSNSAAVEAGSNYTVNWGVKSDFASSYKIYKVVIDGIEHRLDIGSEFASKTFEDINANHIVDIYYAKIAEGGQPFDPSIDVQNSTYVQTVVVGGVGINSYSYGAYVTKGSNFTSSWQPASNINVRNIVDADSGLTTPEGGYFADQKIKSVRVNDYLLEESEYEGNKYDLKNVTEPTLIVIELEQDTHSVDNLAQGSGDISQSRVIYAGQTLNNIKISPKRNLMGKEISALNKIYITKGDGEKLLVYKNTDVSYAREEQENPTPDVQGSEDVVELPSGIAYVIGKEPSSSGATLNIPTIDSNWKIEATFVDYKDLDESGNPKVDEDGKPIVDPSTDPTEPDSPIIVDPEDPSTPPAEGKKYYFSINTVVQDSQGNPVVGSSISATPRLVESTNSSTVKWVTPTGWKATKLTVNGRNIIPVPDGSHTINMIMQKTDVVVTMDKVSNPDKPFEPSEDVEKPVYNVITSIAKGNGWISPSTQVQVGKKLQVDFGAAELESGVNNAIKKLSVNGKEVALNSEGVTIDADGKRGSYVLDPVTEGGAVDGNIEIAVEFEADTFLVTANVEGSATVSGSGTYPQYTSSDKPTIKIVAGTNKVEGVFTNYIKSYTITNSTTGVVYVDQKNYNKTSASFTFPRVIDGNVEVHVVTGKYTHSVTTSYTGKGAISVAGSGLKKLSSTKFEADHNAKINFSWSATNLGKNSTGGARYNVISKVAFSGAYKFTDDGTTKNTTFAKKTVTKDGKKILVRDTSASKQRGSKTGVAVSGDIKASVTSEELVAVYRLYNDGAIGGTSEHLFTTDYSEYISLSSKYKKGDFWKGEGVDWYAPVSGTAVYRLYNPGLGAMFRSSHYYTSDMDEAKNLTYFYGWKWDFNGKPAFYSGGSLPIFTAYSEALGSAHHYTADQAEWQGLDQGWDQEGEKSGGKAAKVYKNKPIYGMKGKYMTDWVPKNGKAFTGFFKCKLSANAALK